MKLLFLDHDGVLAVANPPHQHSIPLNNKYGCYPFDKKAVRVLNRILQKHDDIEIVVSSDWRHYYDIETLQSIYKDSGVIKTPMSVTGMKGDKLDKLEAYRIAEICDWLNDNNIDTSKTPIIVIDDMDLSAINKALNKQVFIHTTFNTGIKKSGIESKINKLINEQS